MSRCRFQVSVLLLVFLATCCVWAQEVSTEVQERGYGPAIKTGETAVVKYRLMVGGELVEQSSEREPFTFEVGSKSVVPGFSRGVVGMKVGETRVVTVPPNLGYGEREMGAIPANSTLVFTITLLQIKETEHEGGHDHDHEGSAKHEEHEHDHEHAGHQHEHSQKELSELFRDDNFLESRNARDIKRPAIYEFLLRDFYTKPWRYDDGYVHVLRLCSKVFLVLLLMVVAYGLGAKKGLLSR